jgi:hypothetical protein
MRRFPALLLLLFLTGKAAVAAELMPVVKDRQLGVVIRAIALPAGFPKDLVSGLTNKLLIHIRLFAGSQLLDQKTAEVSIKYDLWDETFKLTVTVGDATVAERSNSTREAITAFLDDIRIPDVFVRRAVPGDTDVTLRVEMLLNPIERERIETIKKWVAENSTYTPADTPGFSDKRVAPSGSNAIFNKIFEQYAREGDTAAAWQQTLSSKPFRIDEVSDER